MRMHCTNPTCFMGGVPVGGTVFDNCSHCAGRLSSVPSKAAPARPEFWDRFIDKPVAAADRRGSE